MDPSALESVSRRLESSLDFWGTMLLVATLVVVVGLVVEYWHEIKEFWEHVRWPMAAFPWNKFVAIAGGILVTLGVAGELFFTYKASLVESKLRENNHKIEESLNLSAETAAKAADRANASANAAGVAVATAQEKVDKVAKEADVIERQLGKVAKEQVALRWHANLIAKSVSPRLINGKRFMELMRGQPKASVEIWYEPTDEEAKFLAMQINNVLGKDGLGWDTTVGPFPNVPPDEFHAQFRSEASGGLNGLVYAAKRVTADLDSPLQVLTTAIGFSLGDLSIGRAMIFWNPQLPNDHFIIGVGHHVPSIPEMLPSPPKK